MCACAYAYAYKTYEYVWPAWYMLLYWTCVTFVSEGQCGSTFLPLETNKHSSLWAASSATHFSSTPKAKVSEKIHGKFRRLSSSPPTRIFRNGWTCVTQISEWWWKFRKSNHPTNKETRYDQPQFNQAKHFLKGKISPLENDNQPAPSTQPILRFLRKKSPVWQLTPWILLDHHSWLRMGMCPGPTFRLFTCHGGVGHGFSDAPRRNGSAKGGENWKVGRVMEMVDRT